jgi:hypothetical protein
MSKTDLLNYYKQLVVQLEKDEISESHLTILTDTMKKMIFKYENCHQAAAAGDLETLKKMYEDGFPLEINNEEGYFIYFTTTVAAENGHLDCLQFAFENGCDWDEYTSSNAAANGHLDCLRYIYQNECPWDEDTTAKAAKNGHLDCLKYAFKNGCEWDSDTTTNAAWNGHLDCLKYAHENYCPWDEDTPYRAAMGGHLDCLQYVYENGCEWDILTPKVAAENGNIECFKYCFERWDENYQTFWNIRYDLDKIIDKIDLDDQVWKKLFNIDLRMNYDLQTKVEKKIKEIEEMKKVSKEVLEDILPLDIIEYCIYPFI